MLLILNLQVFDKQCEEYLAKLQGIAALSQQITCRTSAPDEVDAIHSRWAAVHDVAVQWGTRLEKLVGTWEEFENEAKKIDTWIQEGQKAVLETPVNLNTPHLDKLEKELVKLKVNISASILLTVSLRKLVPGLCIQKWDHQL
jgi:nesprin-1